ncbi:MAG: hypothetical protein PSV24_17345 [Rhodoferax sp.]|nr:hypothetical protein [Rhodoferax sp.]
MADSQYGRVASVGMKVALVYRAETEWQKQTKRRDFVLPISLSVVQGLAMRLGLSNDIPNELHPDCTDKTANPPRFSRPQKKPAAFFFN